MWAQFINSQNCHEISISTTISRYFKASWEPSHVCLKLTKLSLSYFQTHRLDLRTMQMTNGKSAVYLRSSFATAALNDEIYVIGGYATENESTVEKYGLISYICHLWQNIFHSRIYIFQVFDQRRQLDPFGKSETKTTFRGRNCAQWKYLCGWWIRWRMSSVRRML